MKVFVAVTVCGVVAAVGASVPDASPIAPSFDIYSIGVDGNPPHRLTNGPVDELSPAVSPDGTTIAFSRGPDLWLMNVNGTGERLLVAAPAEVAYKQPSWSANGRFVAFTAWDFSPCSPGSRRCATPSVGVVQSDGNGLRQIRRWAMTPRWSPRTQRLALAGDVRPFDLWPTSIYAVSLTGSGPKLAHAEAGVDSPSWAPNGRRIVYTRSGRAGHVVYSVRADGTGSRRLSRGENPQWSPRGDLIALADRGRLFLIRSSGRPRSKQVAFANSYSWNPRGTRLALVDWRLSVIRPDGRAFRVLCCEDRFGVAAEQPAWSRAGDRIFYAYKQPTQPPS